MMYKEAARIKLRVATKYGNLSVEKLWDLSLSDLDELAIQYDEERENKKSFITSKTKENKLAQLKFDILLDIINTKVEERDERVKNQEKKEKEQEILSIIKEKKSEALKSMSVEELEKLIK